MSNAHEHRQAHELATALDLNGDEYALPDNPTPRSVRSFRSTGAGATAPDTIAHTDLAEARGREHLTRGQADARRNDAQPSGHGTAVADALAPAAVTYSNRRTAQVAPEKAPPARTRGGFTGADPTRPSLMIRPYVMRLFDKGIADHPGRVVKGEMPAPLAARPRELHDLPGGLPYAGGATGTEAAGVGPTRNSFRLLPRAWDATLLNNGTPADTPAPATRGRSFR